MKKLANRFGESAMRSIRASRVNYYSQHDTDIWRDHLGSLGLEGSDSVFVNLAALAGPVSGNPSAMIDVNYKAPIAAARACQSLGFGHWIQSSTFATMTERAAQVQYSRGKAMADFALAAMADLPVSIACLGLLYCKNDGVVGQYGHKLNLVDLSILPLTPIMGSGLAPLQPQEISDAALRIAMLAHSDPSTRPMGRELRSATTTPSVRFYDAVGPQKLTMIEVLGKFAKYNGNKHFRPVHIGYENMEKILDVASLGNLNRQFISLLRSEQQDSSHAAIGDPAAWASILGSEARLTTLDEALCVKERDWSRRRKFPLYGTLKWAWQNPGVIAPGIRLGFETLGAYLNKDDNIIREQENPEMAK